MRSAMQPFVDSQRVAGMLVAVARRDSVVAVETVGFANIEQRQRLDAHSVFRIYSLTKPLTTTAALILLERGRLRLDDEVARYVPEFARTGVLDAGRVRPPARAITIRDLLTHTSGLSYGMGSAPADSAFTALKPYRATNSLATFAATVARAPLHSDPGTEWRYSAATDVLARVIEVASGRPFDRFMAEEVFQPLGMSRTAFRITEPMRPHLTTIYQGSGPALRAVSRVPSAEGFEPDARFNCGGCGLVSTANDYLRFARMLLNRGTLDGVRVLDPSSVALMTQNQLPPHIVALPGAPTGAPREGFGFGFAVTLDEPTPAFPAARGTYAWAGAANTYFWVDPASDIAAVVWVQHLPLGSPPFEDEMRRAVYRLFQGQASVNTTERTTTQIATGVYVIRHPDAPNGFPQGNTTVVIGDSAVLVVDSDYLPSAARDDIADIRKWTDKPVRYLVNTHWHYDHVMGNDEYAAAFPGLSIISHRVTAHEIRTRNPALLEDLRTSTPPLQRQLTAGTDAAGSPLTTAQRDALARRVSSRVDLLQSRGTAPNQSFDESMTVDLGNREVRILFLGKGNTAGDAVVFLPAERIAVSGDLLAHPVPYLAGGYPGELAQTLGRLRALEPRTIVPGHGEVLSGTAYLETVREFVSLVVAEVNAEFPRLVKALTESDAMEKAVAARIDLAAWRMRFGGAVADNARFFDSFSWPGLIKAAFAEAWGR